jgi:hypothetical protein
MAAIWLVFPLGHWPQLADSTNWRSNLQEASASGKSRPHPASRRASAFGCFTRGVLVIVRRIRGVTTLMTVVSEVTPASIEQTPLAGFFLEVCRSDAIAA